MSECIFCRIAEGTIPATVLYQDEYVVAFRDANPQAPVHTLVVPRRHLASTLELVESGDDLVARIVDAAVRVAQDAGLTAPERGYRLVWNSGPQAGQSVYHVHVHVLGGRDLGWPPG